MAEILLCPLESVAGRSGHNTIQAYSPKQSPPLAEERQRIEALLRICVVFVPFCCELGRAHTPSNIDKGVRTAGYATCEARLSIFVPIIIIAVEFGIIFQFACQRCTCPIQPRPYRTHRNIHRLCDFFVFEI